VPSHKALKGVVRNIVESFTSLMNYLGDDYVMCHIVSAAWSTAATELHVDLLTGETGPSPLLVLPVRESVAGYVKDFPDLLHRSRSDIEFVASAQLSVVVDPTSRRQYRLTELYESPFTCSSRIVDDRGKLYEYELSSWWYPEQPPRDNKRWWQLWRRQPRVCGSRRSLRQAPVHEAGFSRL